MKRFGLFVALLAVASVVAAQSYPDRAVRVIVPWPPGQATDLVARIVSQKLSESLGQPFIIENKAGAGGQIGTDAVAKAAPDGYTLLAASAGPVTVSPLLQKVPYDVDKNFAFVHLFGVSPYVLVTNPSFPANNAREFIALVRANPDKYSFSSSGTGAAAHLITEWFNSLAQLKATHVPYKGSSPALIDVMNGQIAYTMETMVATSPYVKSGKLKAFGVSISRRSVVLPDVPTLIEGADLKGFDIGAWLGWMFPVGTSPAIVARISSASAKALEATDTRERISAIGLEIDSRGADAFAVYLKEQQAKFRDIIKTGNIKVE
ncbi:MAG: Bug family tripartite tricarboxylate transporter substrate binding protein [Burkholderiales bacterium]